MNRKQERRLRRLLRYRLPMPVTNAYRYTGGSWHGCHTKQYPICPRCGVPLEREYQAYCDRCGQKLERNEGQKL